MSPLTELFFRFFLLFSLGKRLRNQVSRRSEISGLSVDQNACEAFDISGDLQSDLRRNLTDGLARISIFDLHDHGIARLINCHVDRRTAIRKTLVGCIDGLAKIFAK